MKKTRVNIIGLGEIGYETLKAMVKTPYLYHPTCILAERMEFYATDIDESKLKAAKELGAVKFSTKPFKKCDVYIVCVWSTEQILEVLAQIRKLNGSREYIVSIESTIDPLAVEEILKNRPVNETIAAFPHRYMFGDDAHGIFNQNRVLGVVPVLRYEKVSNFYEDFFDAGYKIIKADFEDAVLTKVLENSYRYMEIVLAQELSNALGASRFERLRHLANTKWNINIKQALNGVKGKCLPKDMELLYKLVGDKPSIIVGMLQAMNKDFINGKTHNNTATPNYPDGWWPNEIKRITGRSCPQF